MTTGSDSTTPIPGATTSVVAGDVAATTEEAAESTTTSSGAETTTDPAGLLDAAEEEEVHYRKCCRTDEYYHTDVEKMTAKCQPRRDGAPLLQQTTAGLQKDDGDGGPDSSVGGVRAGPYSGDGAVSADGAAFDLFPWEPWTVYDEYLAPLDEAGQAGLVMNVSVGFPICSSKKRSYMALMDPTDVFQLLDSGSLYIPAFSKSYKPPLYCLDETLLEDDDGRQARQQVVLLCVEDGRQFAPRVSPRDGIMYPIISACLLVSAGSLLVTVFVYFVTPEGWNLHGETLQCHVGSLSLGYLLLFSARVATKQQLKYRVLCKAIGILAHFFLLSAFFWLNVMCFDVFWTIRRFRSRESMGNPRQWKKFFKYCAYALGVPLLISGVALGVDLSAMDSRLNPRFSDASRHCWFTGSDWAIFAYLYGPVAVLLVANTVMFAFTIRHLIQHQKDTAALRENKRSAAQNKQRLVLYIELFVIMGLTWVAEVISWKLGAPEFWYVFDLLNALQGVFIFFIFVCKPKILRHLRDYFLRKKWCCPCCKHWLLGTVFAVSSSGATAEGAIAMGAIGMGLGGGPARRASSTGTQQTMCSRLSSTDSVVPMANGGVRRYIKNSASGGSTAALMDLRRLNHKYSVDSCIGEFAPYSRSVSRLPTTASNSNFSGGGANNKPQHLRDRKGCSESAAPSALNRFSQNHRSSDPCQLQKELNEENDAGMQVYSIEPDFLKRRRLDRQNKFLAGKKSISFEEPATSTEASRNEKLHRSPPPTAFTTPEINDRNTFGEGLDKPSDFSSEREEPNLPAVKKSADSAALGGVNCNLADSEPRGKKRHLVESFYTSKDDGEETGAAVPPESNQGSREAEEVADSERQDPSNPQEPEDRQESDSDVPFSSLQNNDDIIADERL